MDKDPQEVFNVGDIVSTTVFPRTGIVGTKVFDQCRGEFVYSIKAGALTLVNVLGKEIIKGDLNA